MKIGGMIHGGSRFKTEMEILAAASGYGQATLDVWEHKKTLKALDVEAFWQEMIKIGNGTPPVSRHAVLAMMHKIRAQWRFKKSFTDGERRISKRWLKKHGYTTNLDDVKMREVQRG